MQRQTLIQRRPRYREAPRGKMMSQQRKIQPQGGGGTETLGGSEGNHIGGLGHTVIVDQNESVFLETLQRSFETLGRSVVQYDARPFMTKAQRFVGIGIFKRRRPECSLELEQLQRCQQFLIG